MGAAANQPASPLDKVMPQLGFILWVLFCERYKKGPPVYCQAFFQNETLLQGVPSDLKEAMLTGMLAVLRGMGLVYVDAHGELRTPSRYADFALGSLSKFLTASSAAVDEPVEDTERRYLINLTHALESARVENPHVDHEPIHARRIVNVLIRGRQIRHWKTQDVYLHILHRQWKEYHLVGLSPKDAPMTDDDLARLAMKTHLELDPDQYDLDASFNPLDVEDTRISATSGALTKYTYSLRAVKDIRVALDLGKLIEKNKLDENRFRWFTWEEMKQRQSEQGEPIMFSRATLMEREELRAMPMKAIKANGIRYPGASIDLLRYLSYRVTGIQLLALAVILFLVALLIIFLRRSIPPSLSNTANIAEILSFALSFLIFLLSIASRAWPKDV